MNSDSTLYLMFFGGVLSGFLLALALITFLVLRQMKRERDRKIRQILDKYGG